MEDGYLCIHIKIQSSHFETVVIMHCSVVFKEAFGKSVDLVDHF